MPIYKNINNFVVHLIGPDGYIAKVESNSTVVLTDYYDKYVKKGLIIKISDTKTEEMLNSVRQYKPATQTNVPLLKHKLSQHTPIEIPYKLKKKTQINKGDKIDEDDKNKKTNKLLIAKKIIKSRRALNTTKRKIVGQQINENATSIHEKNIDNIPYTISNNIGVGILSYERLESLERLIKSIIKYSDPSTTIIVSDDGSNNADLRNYLESLRRDKRLIILRNKRRAGVAGNSNRLLRCLKRFNYGLLLNDDVEILDYKWEYFYPNHLDQTGLHHLIYREPGVYGAKSGEETTIKDIKLSLVTNKPQGAVLAFTHRMLDTCGYFNEDYGLYGMEHVDWSLKAHEFNLQRRGYIDVIGSSKYFKVHKETSAVQNRSALFHQSKIMFANRKPKVKIEYQHKDIPEITYIIPFRNTERSSTINTVINNIRAQTFPVINISLIEQDEYPKIDINKLNPIIYHQATLRDNKLFNKSYAFNIGVNESTTDKIVLHDADMLIQDDYTTVIYDMLDKNDFSHLGKNVLYATEESSNYINTTLKVDSSIKFDRIVGYFEGGSLACTKDAYWNCGGFNEDFKGYGCEDCDFFARIAHKTKYDDYRSYDFIHLWHPRTSGWTRHHDQNKKLEQQLNAVDIETRITNQINKLKANNYKIT